MLAPWKKSYDQPRQHIKKQRHYFANKDLYSQSCGFSRVIYGCDTWTIKEAEHWRNDAFELYCWRRLIRVPWTERSNQSILKEINPEYPLERLMLKLQYFGHLMWRTDSLEKTLTLGKIEGRRRRGWQDKMVGWQHWLNGHEFEQTPGVGDGQGNLVGCSPSGCKESDTAEQLSNNNNELMLSILSCDSWPSICLLWRNVHLGLLSFVDWVVCFGAFKHLSCLLILETNPSQSHHLQIFSHYLCVVFSFCLLFPLLCKGFWV